jgi:hypothetical protein
VDMRIMFRSGPADRLPVARYRRTDRSPVPAAGRPATRRPVQVDRSTGPAAGWVAGEGGVAARSHRQKPVRSRETVKTVLSRVRSS